MEAGEFEPALPMDDARGVAAVNIASAPPEGHRELRCTPILAGWPLARGRGVDQSVVGLGARPDEETRTVSGAIADRAAARHEASSASAFMNAACDCPAFPFAARNGVDPPGSLVTEESRRWTWA